MSRWNLTKKIWHENNLNAAKILSWFNSFDDTTFCMKDFFHWSRWWRNLKTVLKNNKIKFRPSYLTGTEKMLITKMLIQSFKNSLWSWMCLGTASRTCDTYRSCLFIIPIWHPMLIVQMNYQTNTLKKLNKSTHLFDGKQLIIELMRNNNIF